MIFRLQPLRYSWVLWTNGPIGRLNRYQYDEYIPSPGSNTMLMLLISVYVIPLDLRALFVLYFMALGTHTCKEVFAWN